jgi:hypothetical protein
LNFIDHSFRTVMKARILLVLGMTASFWVGMAAEPVPRIQPDKTVYSFGKVIGKDTVAGKFKFTNTGSGVLRLADPKVQCGCTVASLEPRLLNPGENAELEFTFALGTARAFLAKHITVFSNDPDRPEIELTINVDYTPLFDLTPRFFNLSLRQGETTNLLARLARTDGQALNIQRMEPSQPWIDATIKRIDGANAQISLALKPGGVPRRISEVLRIIPEETNAPPAIIYLMGQVFGAVRLDPSTTVWNVTDRDALTKPGWETLATRKLIARSTTPGKPFHVRSLSSSIKEIKLESTPTSDGYQITAVLTAIPAQSGRGTITVETDLADQPSVDAEITVIAPPNGPTTKSGL